MRKAVKNLVSCDCNKTIGNHRSEHIGDVVRYIYFQTAICVVNNKKKTFMIDNGGWNTSSTNRAINDYRRYFEELGYEEIK